jgi:hypothetical protein
VKPSGCSVDFPSSDFWKRAQAESESLFVSSSTAQELKQQLQEEVSRHRSGFLRLGHYFELLLGYWLKNSSRFQMLADHHAVYDPNDGRTIGEADWIVQAFTAAKTQHWEAALKFYLARHDTTDFNGFVGPEPAGDDTLFRKLNHMINQQLQLPLERFEPLERVCCLKGRLFLPWSAGTPIWRTIQEYAALDPGGVPLAALGIGSQTPVAPWVSECDWLSFQDAVFEQAQCKGFLKGNERLATCVLPKSHWMAALRSSDTGPFVHTPVEIAEQMHRAAGRPLMVALCRLPKSDNLQGLAFDNPVTEWMRCFLVPNGHPRLA